MAIANSGSNSQSITGINITPLVDVVLVLLVVLMVTAGYIVSRTIPIDLPQGATGETLTTTLAVSVDAEGLLYLDAQRIDDADLRAALRRAKAESRDVRAVIAADGSARHRAVIGVVDLLRQEGVYKFAFNIEPLEATP